MQPELIAPLAGAATINPLPVNPTVAALDSFLIWPRPSSVARRAPVMPKPWPGSHSSLGSPSAGPGWPNGCNGTGHVPINEQTQEC